MKIKEEQVDLVTMCLKPSFSTGRLLWLAVLLEGIVISFVDTIPLSSVLLITVYR
jgi:hypothetical protein